MAQKSAWYQVLLFPYPLVADKKIDFVNTTKYCRCDSVVSYMKTHKLNLLNHMMIITLLLLYANTKYLTYLK